jgi:hypothetical protein
MKGEIKEETKEARPPNPVGRGRSSVYFIDACQILVKQKIHYEETNYFVHLSFLRYGKFVFAIEQQSCVFKGSII